MNQMVTMVVTYVGQMMTISMVGFMDKILAKSNGLMYKKLIWMLALLPSLALAEVWQDPYGYWIWLEENRQTNRYYSNFLEEPPK